MLTSRSLIITLLMALPACLCAAQQAEEIPVVLEANVDVWSLPFTASQKLGKLKKGDTMYVTGYRPLENVYQVRYKQKTGYVDAARIKPAEALTALMEKAKAAPAAGRIDDREAKREVLTLLYGERIAARIMEGKAWVGMTKEMLIQSIGTPKSVKRLAFANLIKEQWQYEDGRTFYFENDKLAAIGGPPPGIQPRNPDGVNVPLCRASQVHDLRSDASAAPAGAGAARRRRGL